MMRYLPLVILLFNSALASEPTFPLWDGSDSVSDYAKRNKLQATQTLDLGGGIKMELVLIPAGRFVMGTPEPKEPTESVAVGQGILYFGIACVPGLPLVVLFHAIRTAASELWIRVRRSGSAASRSARV